MPLMLARVADLSTNSVWSKGKSAPPACASAAGAVHERGEDDVEQVREEAAGGEAGDGDRLPVEARQRLQLFLRLPRGGVGDGVVGGEGGRRDDRRKAEEYKYIDARSEHCLDYAQAVGTGMW
jgi:hypothetical protein